MNATKWEGEYPATKDDHEGRAAFRVEVGEQVWFATQAAGGGEYRLETCLSYGPIIEAYAADKSVAKRRRERNAALVDLEMRRAAAGRLGLDDDEKRMADEITEMLKA